MARNPDDPKKTLHGHIYLPDLGEKGTEAITKFNDAQEDLDEHIRTQEDRSYALPPVIAYAIDPPNIEDLFRLDYLPSWQNIRGLWNFNDDSTTNHAVDVSFCGTSGGANFTGLVKKDNNWFSGVAEEWDGVEWDGVFNNLPAELEGPFLRCDSTEDFAAEVPGVLHNPGTGFTIDFWFCPTKDIDGTTYDGFTYLFAKVNSALRNVNNVWISNEIFMGVFAAIDGNPGGQLGVFTHRSPSEGAQVYAVDDADPLYSGVYTLENSWRAGTWHHVTISWGTTNGLILWIDGQTGWAGSSVGTATTMYTPGRKHNLTIGGYWSGPSEALNKPDMLVSNLRVSNTERDQLYVDTVYGGGDGYTGSYDSNTIAYIKFNEGSGKEAYNSIPLQSTNFPSYGNPGVVKSGIVYQADRTVLEEEGPTGSALFNDDNEEYLDCGAEPHTNLIAHETKVAGGFTFQTAIKLNELNKDQCIISKWDEFNDQRQLYVGIDSNNRVEVKIGLDGLYDSTASLSSDVVSYPFITVADAGLDIANGTYVDQEGWEGLSLDSTGIYDGVPYLKMENCEDPTYNGEFVTEADWETIHGITDSTQSFTISNAGVDDVNGSWMDKTKHEEVYPPTGVMTETNFDTFDSTASLYEVVITDINDVVDGVFEWTNLTGSDGVSIWGRDSTAGYDLYLYRESTGWVIRDGTTDTDNLYYWFHKRPGDRLDVPPSHWFARINELDQQLSIGADPGPTAVVRTVSGQIEIDSEIKTTVTSAGNDYFNGDYLRLGETLNGVDIWCSTIHDDAFIICDYLYGDTDLADEWKKWWMGIRPRDHGFGEFRYHFYAPYQITDIEDQAPPAFLKGYTGFNALGEYIDESGSDAAQLKTYLEDGSKFNPDLIWFHTVEGVTENMYRHEDDDSLILTKLRLDGMTVTQWYMAHYTDWDEFGYYYTYLYDNVAGSTLKDIPSSFNGIVDNIPIPVIIKNNNKENFVWTQESQPVWRNVQDSNVIMWNNVASWEPTYHGWYLATSDILPRRDFTTPYSADYFPTTWYSWSDFQEPVSLYYPLQWTIDDRTVWRNTVDPHLVIRRKDFGDNLIYWQIAYGLDNNRDYYFTADNVSNDGSVPDGKWVNNATLTSTPLATVEYVASDKIVQTISNLILRDPGSEHVSTLSNSTIDDLNWHCIHVSWNSQIDNGKANIFIDGVEETSYDLRELNKGSIPYITQDGTILPWANLNIGRVQSLSTGLPGNYLDARLDLTILWGTYLETKDVLRQWKHLLEGAQDGDRFYIDDPGKYYDNIRKQFIKRPASGVWEGNDTRFAEWRLDPVTGLFGWNIVPIQKIAGVFWNQSKAGLDSWMPPEFYEQFGDYGASGSFAI